MFHTISMRSMTHFSKRIAKGGKKKKKKVSTNMEGEQTYEVGPIQAHLK